MIMTCYCESILSYEMLSILCVRQHLELIAPLTSPVAAFEVCLDVAAGTFSVAWITVVARPLRNHLLGVIRYSQVTRA